MDPTQRAFRHLHVVPNEVELRVPALREEELVWVADLDLTAGDLEDLLPRGWHW